MRSHGERSIDNLIDGRSHVTMFFCHALAAADFPHRSIFSPADAGVGLLAFGQAAPLACVCIYGPFAIPKALNLSEELAFWKNAGLGKFQKYTQNQCVDSNLLVCDVMPNMPNFGKPDANSSRTGEVVMLKEKEGTAM